MFQKIKLLKACFPDSWLRKCIFLIYPTETVNINGKLAAFITKKGDEIILIGVRKEYRSKGLATKLIKRTKAKYAYTYKKNKAAIDFYMKNNFKIKGEKNTIFGIKVLLERVNEKGK